MSGRPSILYLAETLSLWRRVGHTRAVIQAAREHNGMVVFANRSQSRLASSVLAGPGRMPDTCTLDDIKMGKLRGLAGRPLLLDNNAVIAMANEVNPENPQYVPWESVEQIAEWVRSIGEEGIADAILEGRHHPTQKERGE